MKLGIMQPYFFPYIGYWQLMNAVDRYVIYDDVNFIKGGWINRNRQRYSDFGFGLWAVCLVENGVMIGDCGLTMQNINGTILPEIGYHIAKIHQNKGYATEAARAVRDWTFTVTPFRSLYSYMKKENLPSAAVARANGMTLTDEFTDDEGERSLVYQITRTEWLKNN